MIKLKKTDSLDISPVELEEAKIHLSVSHNSDDGLIQGFLDAATEFVEGYTGRKLISQIWQLTCSSWEEAETVLPFGNLGVVLSVAYKDPDGVSKIISGDEYGISGIGTDEGEIVFLSGFSSPSLYEFDPITIEFNCGYPSADQVPDSLKSAILLKLSELYEDVDTEKAVHALCGPFRLWRF